MTIGICSILNVKAKIKKQHNSCNLSKRKELLWIQKKGICNKGSSYLFKSIRVSKRRYTHYGDPVRKIVVRSSSLHGAMVKILDICWNVIIQHQYWIQIFWIYNEDLFAIKENTLSQWDYGKIVSEYVRYLSGRFTF